MTRVSGCGVTRQRDVVTVFAQFVEAVVRVGPLHPGQGARSRDTQQDNDWQLL